jgi:phage gp16-like protein
MNHIAAIHTMKTRIGMTDEDYRALLRQLVSQDSCKAMTAAQLIVVRTHFEKLARHMGVKRPAVTRPTGAQSAGAALDGPQYRKLRALWWALADAKVVARPASPQACDKAVETWAKRQLTGTTLGPLDALRFASGAQTNKLIEELKAWCLRVGAALQ